MRVCAALGAALLCWGMLASGAEAQTPPDASAESEARVLYQQGRELAAAERWGEALELFRRARARHERPSVVYAIATCLFTLGRHVEAIGALDDFLRIAGPNAGERERAAEMAAESRRAIGTLRLRLSPPDAMLRLDGRRLEGAGAEREIPLDPGEHIVQVSAPGYMGGDLRLSILPGQSVEHTIELRRVPAPRATQPRRAPPRQPPRPRRPPEDDAGGGLLASPVFWVVVGAVVIGGAVTLGAVLYEPGVEPPLEGTEGVATTLLAFP